MRKPEDAEQRPQTAVIQNKADSSSNLEPGMIRRGYKTDSPWLENRKERIPETGGG